MFCDLNVWLEIGKKMNEWLIDLNMHCGCCEMIFLGCENIKHLVARWVNRKLLDDSSLCNYSVENTRIMLVPTFPRLAHKIYLTTKATEVGQQCGKD